MLLWAAPHDRTATVHAATRATFDRDRDVSRPFIERVLAHFRAFEGA